jgi:hypothetical protein
MTNERINELKRYIELSERSYNECRYLFTDFLTEDQISNLLEHEKELYPSGIRFFPSEKYALTSWLPLAAKKTSDTKKNSQ